MNTVRRVDQKLTFVYITLLYKCITLYNRVSGRVLKRLVLSSAPKLLGVTVSTSATCTVAAFLLYERSGVALAIVNVVVTDKRVAFYFLWLQMINKRRTNVNKSKLSCWHLERRE